MASRRQHVEQVLGMHWEGDVPAMRCESADAFHETQLEDAD